MTYGSGRAVSRMESLVREIVEVALRVDEATVDLVLALRSPIATKVMTSVTGLGSASAALVFLGAFSLAGWRDELRHSAVALVLTGAVVGTLMVTIQRPFPPAPVCLTDGEAVAHSFPSGHAAAVAVFAMTARRSTTLPFAPVAILAATIAVSRIYLGTHYLSDTIVGIGIGIGAAVAAERLVRRIDWSRLPVA